MSVPTPKATREAQSGFVLWGHTYVSPFHPNASWNPLKSIFVRPGVQVVQAAAESDLTYRACGGLQAVGGVAEMTVGGSLEIAPDPTLATKVGGWVLIVHGADHVQTGIHVMWYGRSVDTLTTRGIRSGLESLDVDPGWADFTARTVDGAIGVIGPAKAGQVIAGVDDAARQFARKADTTGSVSVAPRRILTAADVTAGMEISPAEVNIYRGGSSLQARPIDFKVDPATGMLKTTHGLSLDVSAEAMSRFGGAFRIESIPAELRIIQRGGKLGHFEIVPRSPITPQRFQELLDQITLVPEP